MSMSLRLCPCDCRPSDAGNRYYAEVAFVLHKNCTWILNDIVNNSKPIDIPVEIMWVSHLERRAVADIDTTCTWLVEAWVLKTMDFHGDGWHPDVITQSKAVSAYLRELPDDWPVIVYNV